MGEGIEMQDDVELLRNVFLVERLARESSGERRVDRPNNRRRLPFVDHYTVTVRLRGGVLDRCSCRKNLEYVWDVSSCPS